MRKLTVPHCKHCKFSTSKMNCTKLMMTYGFKGMKYRRCSRSCKDFIPTEQYKELYN